MILGIDDERRSHKSKVHGGYRQWCCRTHSLLLCRTRCTPTRRFVKKGGPTPPVTPVPRVGLLLHQPLVRLRRRCQEPQALAAPGNLLFLLPPLSRPQLRRRQVADLPLVPIRLPIAPARIPNLRIAPPDLMQPIRPMRPLMRRNGPAVRRNMHVASSSSSSASRRRSNVARSRRRCDS